MISSILVLTDFSTSSTNAVTAAFKLASQYKATLTIYHSIDENEFIYFDENSNIQIEILTDTNRILTEKKNLWQSVATENKLDLKVIFGSGDPVVGAQLIISTNGIDLLLMGHKGWTKNENSVWGSNTVNMIDKATIPVMVVKREMRDYQLDNLVFASSFETSEKDPFQNILKKLTPPSDSIIHLVSIDTLGYFYEPTILMKQSMKEFEALAIPYQTTSHFYDDYSVTAGIRNFVDEIKPDLLIMANKSSNPIVKFFNGSTIEKVIHESDFPVLIIANP